MIQELFDVNLVDQYFQKHPGKLLIRSNKVLYPYCNASTDANKQNVRRRKAALVKKKNDTKLNDSTKKNGENDPIGDESIQYLNQESLDQIVINLINGSSKIKESVVRIAVDYYTKVKASKKEGIKQLLDMEGFLKIGENLK